jgi:hypothetical protein
MACRICYRLPLQEGAEMPRFVPVSRYKPVILQAHNTHARLPGRQKAHFYNMRGYGGQTVFGSSTGFSLWGFVRPAKGKTPQAKQAAEKVPWFVILSEAKNPSWIKTKD